MEKKVYFDLETLKFILKQYKVFLIPVLVIFISLAIFLEVVLPQIQNVINAREEAKIAYQNVLTLKSNLNTLSHIDDGVLDSELQILTSALPLSKDFGGVFDSLSKASQKAGVSLGNYEFKVGDLSKNESSGKITPSLELSLVVTGSIKNIGNFIDILEKSVPLAEVTSVQIGSLTSNLKTVFYYKSITAPQHTDTLPIHSVS